MWPRHMGKYFMNRIKIAPEYSENYLETDRPQPLSDNTIESLIEELLPHKWGYETSDNIYTQFKSEVQNWLFNSKLNSITGFDIFDRLDICMGCTQFIDTVYMNGPAQFIQGDYRYHERLGNSYQTPGNLLPNVPLIIAMPFPSTGDVHHQMNDILNECLDKNIKVHIDGAWISCCRDIKFDLNHDAISSIGISLSKGLGLGWNRIGLRWTRQQGPDAVTIMNDFRMNNRALTMIGLHFVRQLPPDYLWNKYGSIYYKICDDFNLTPTNSIYLALKGTQPVGLSPLIRYVAEK